MKLYSIAVIAAVLATVQGNIPEGGRIRIGEAGDIGVSQTGTYGSMAGECVMRDSSGNRACQDAFIIESHTDNLKSGGIAMNGNTMVFWNSGINNAINFVDEDDPTATLWHATSTGSFATGSDERIKEDIEPFSDSFIMERIQKLQPKTFTFRGDDYNKTELGLIAQEVDAIGGFDHILSKPHAAGGFFTLQYDRMPLYLIHGLQKIMSDVDEIAEPARQLLDQQNIILEKLSLI